MGNPKLATAWIITTLGLLIAPAGYARTARSAAGAVQRQKADFATVERRDADRVFVRGPGVKRFGPGMAVWISQPGGAGMAGLPVAEAKVVYVHSDQAVIELQKGAGALPDGAVVEPRFVAEARLYRATLDRSAQPNASAADAAKSPSAPRWRVWHRPAKTVAHGGQLWLEAVATPDVSALEARWRLGNTGRYVGIPMQANDDGMWTASIALGQTDPLVRGVQYYIVGRAPGDTDKGRTALAGHPAEPLLVTITSIPRKPRTVMIDHEPPGRVTHKQPLVLTARVNPRYRNAVVFFRPRGGGTFDALPMRQITPEVFRAVIPAAKVVVPGLSYYIAVTDSRGVVRDGFANRRSPRNVAVTRGRLLTSEKNRNHLSLRWEAVDYGAERDGFTVSQIRFSRRFFGFLVARGGAMMLKGEAPAEVLNDKGQPIVGELGRRAIDIYAGVAGIQLLIGDYVSVYNDIILGIHNDGAGFGYELGARIGDEAGAHMTGSWRSFDDVDTGAPLVQRFTASLSAPVTDRLRLSGTVIHEDVMQFGSEGLRLQIAASVALTERVSIEAYGGLAGRDADRVGGTGGASFGLLF